MNESLAKENVTFVDIGDKFLLGNDINVKYFLTDRLHPNPLGTGVIFEAIKKQMKLVNLTTSKYVPPVSTAIFRKSPALPTRPLPRNKTSVANSTNLYSQNLPQGSLSITKHPPGVFPGIGDHNPGMHPKSKPKPKPARSQQKKEQNYK